MILVPHSEAEAAAMIGDAAARRSPVEIIGGGTKRAIGQPLKTAITLSSSGLSGIVAYTPSEMVMTAKAGTPLDTIKTALAANNQELAFDPLDYRGLLASTGTPTIGAVAAANLSGPRRFVIGAARDALLGVRFVNGQGEIIKNGGRVMKNVTGLDLVKLMAGSWGTLGFLTEVTFKVLPLAQTETTLVLLGLDDAAGMAALAAALATHCEVSGAAHIPEIINASLLGGQLKSAGATLLRLQGTAQSVAIRLAFLQQYFKAIAQLVLDAETSGRLWRQVRDVEPFQNDHRPVWRVSMAPSDGYEMVDVLRRHAGLAAFYDWQGGLIWLRMEAEVEAGLVRKTIVACGGGHATLIRANEATRAVTPVFQPQQKAVATLTARVKAAFDPADIFNPGRIFKPAHRGA
jgi:glycolate oxidase FAD binding subunit